MSLKNAEIKELRDEPSCDSNKGNKEGCARPTPGATAGGCTLDGALIALLPITDVAHIVHGSIACIGSAWGIRGSGTTGEGLYKMGMTTDLNEVDVVMGRGEARLLHSIRQAVSGYSPKAVFVYETCLTALIGDDVESICKAAEQKLDLPVIHVPSAGFYGSKNFGNRIAGDTMLKHVIGTAEPKPLPETTPEGHKIHHVNLIGEFNIAGEFWHVLPLLDKLGINVRGTMSGDARFHDIQHMHRADVSMVVCSKALMNVARGLETQYGIPWFEGSFYGVRDTSNALRSFASMIGDDDLIARTEVLIAEEEQKINQDLEFYREKLADKRVLLYTGGVKSWSVLSALQDDLGMKVVVTGVKKSTPEDKERIKMITGDDIQMIDNGNPENLIRLCDAYNVDVLVAGGRNMYTALKALIPFLHINQEREHPYAGYEGMLILARELDRTINNPLWKAIAEPAPWEAM